MVAKSNIGSNFRRIVVPSFSVGLMSASHPLLSVTQWLDVTLVTDLSGLLLAVLDVFVPLSFLGMSLHLKLADLLLFVSANQPLLGIARCLEAFLLALVADLPELLLAVLDIAILLSLHLELVDLLRLEMIVLPFTWEGEDIGDRLANPLCVRLAYLYLGLPRGVVTSLVHFRQKRTIHLSIGTCQIRIRNPDGPYS